MEMENLIERSKLFLVLLAPATLFGFVWIGLASFCELVILGYATILFDSVSTLGDRITLASGALNVAFIMTAGLFVAMGIVEAQRKPMTLPGIASYAIGFLVFAFALTIPLEILTRFFGEMLYAEVEAITNRYQLAQSTMQSTALFLAALFIVGATQLELLKQNFRQL